MEQSVFRNSGSKKRNILYKLRAGVLKFFRETFRAHTRDEYAEFFSRGKGGNGENHNKYPWFYIRALALGFVLFSIITLVFKLSGDSFDYPALILFGGLMFNIPLLIFFFELYPARDLGFITLILVTLLGGTLAASLSGLGYKFIYGDLFGFVGTGWLSLIFTGFWEELVKAVAVVLAAILLKKRDPLICLLIGVAVGTGFSIYEDMGYIFAYATKWNLNIDMKWAVLCSVGRGLACFCSHAPWTACVGWAFGKFGLKKYPFYAVLFGSMFLHYWADAPFFCTEVLWDRGGVVIWIVEISATLAETILMIRNSRRVYLPNDGQNELHLEYSHPVLKSQRYAHIADLTGCITCVLLGIAACVFMVLPSGEDYIFSTVDLYDSQSFIQYMQGGRTLSADRNRQYDENMSDYSQYVVQGSPAYAVQEVEQDGYFYYYFYTFSEGEAALDGIGVVVDYKIYYCRRIERYADFMAQSVFYPPNASWVVLPVDPDDIEVVEDEEPSDEEEPSEGEEVEPLEPEEAFDCFFVNTQNFAGYYYDFDKGCYVVSTYEIVTASRAGQIAVYVLSGLIFAGGTAAYITLKIKARRNKYA